MPEANRDVRIVELPHATPFDGWFSKMFGPGDSILDTLDVEKPGAMLLCRLSREIPLK